ncbi:MAG: hypothetical protein KF851_10020 [Pirellulaceae bacterium]|nr:hypothetical protein [Pirellulaceae bacterium]
MQRVFFVIISLLGAFGPCGLWGQQVDQKEGDSQLANPVIIRVPLPIDQRVREQIVKGAESVLDRFPPTVRAETRPTLILQFETDRGQTGAGSKLADCQEIASILTSERFARVRTVAYVPGLRASRMALDPASRRGPVLEGHAVLVALATEQIVLDPETVLGSAVSSEDRFDSLTVDVYKNIASRRLTLPLSVAMTFVDPRASLHWATTAQGEELVDREQLSQLESAGRVVQSETLKKVGDLAAYSAQQLIRISPNCLIAADRNELASKLGVGLQATEIDNRGTREWKAVRFEVPQMLDQRSVDWGIRAIENQIQSSGANLVIIHLSGGSGNYKVAMRLARYLAELNPEEIQTTAYIDRGGASGPLAIVALACHHVLMQQNAELGGSYAPMLYPDEIKAIVADLPFISDVRERDLGLLRGMIDLEWRPVRVQNLLSGEARWIDPEEEAVLEPAKQWVNRGPLELNQALTAAECENQGVVRMLLKSEEEISVYYQLRESPKLIKPTEADRMLANFASFLSSPLVSFWLVMFAIMLLSTESSSPGLGVPGFLGTVFLVLFFWSQYFGGNATWFEILLFLTGAIFLVIELFVLPGFGIFGIGGLLMMITAVVLATQSFIIPRTQREFEHLPYTLGMGLALASGCLVTLMVLRRYARQFPVVREMMLEPPEAEAEYERELSRSEFAVEVGQRGVTVTKLMPTGKARIGNRVFDVISDGAVIETAAQVEIVEAVGNRIVVRDLS